MSVEIRCRKASEGRSTYCTKKLCLDINTLEELNYLICQDSRERGFAECIADSRSYLNNHTFSHGPKYLFAFVKTRQMSIIGRALGIKVMYRQAGKKQEPSS